MATEAPYYLFLTETSSKSMRQTALERIHESKPIYIAYEQHGDVMISWWAHTQVLMQLCRDDGIPMTPEALPLKRADLQFDDFYPLLDAIAKYPGSLHGRYQPAGEMELLCRALDITRLDPELLSQPPQPLPTNDGPLKDFDREEMLHIRERLMQHRSGKQEITILQTGSNPLKRYNDQQIRELVTVAKDSHEDALVRVITDRNLIHEGDRSDFGADEVVDFTNINTLTAYLSLDDTLFVTTDSFWTWLMAGAQAIVGQEAQAIVLYTLADSIRYGIPHAIKIESEAVRGAQSPGIVDAYGNGVISTSEYQKYWLKRRKPLGFPGDIDIIQPHAIRPEDFQRVKEAVAKTVI